MISTNERDVQAIGIPSKTTSLRVVLGKLLPAARLSELDWAILVECRWPIMSETIRLSQFSKRSESLTEKKADIG